MPFIDDTWLRKAHQALRHTFEVDSNLRKEMIQFLYDEGFWDPDKLKWDSAISRFNDCCNPTKEAYWKIGEVWALMLRFQRPQLLQAMAESMGYELRLVPTEARRQMLLEEIIANQRRFEETQQELIGNLDRLCAAPIESRLPSLPGQRPHFSIAEEVGSIPPTAVGRVGCP